MLARHVRDFFKYSIHVFANTVMTYCDVDADTAEFYAKVYVFSSKAIFNEFYMHQIQPIGIYQKLKFYDKQVMYLQRDYHLPLRTTLSIKGC